MSRFTGALTITQLSGKANAWRLWQLHEALIYELGEEGSGNFVVVPNDFISDGPTIPRLFWPILPVWGTWGRAGILHDYLTARVMIGHPHECARTRAQADTIFYEAMTVLGVGYITCWLLYCGTVIATLFRIWPRMTDYNRDLLELEVHNGQLPPDHLPIGVRHG